MQTNEMAQKKRLSMLSELQTRLELQWKKHWQRWEVSDIAKFKVNKEMFGKYVKIPTGYTKEMHIYKVVSFLYSNSYCDVPIVYGSEPKNHECVETEETPYGLEAVLNVIHCGIDETKVVRVALKDCEIVEPKTNAYRIRAMSDEELAEFIEEIVSGNRDIVGINCGNNKCESSKCTKCINDWLKSEAKE